MRVVDKREVSFLEEKLMVALLTPPPRFQYENDQRSSLPHKEDCQPLESKLFSPL